MKKIIALMLVAFLCAAHMPTMAKGTLKKAVGAYIVYKYVTRDKAKAEERKNNTSASEEKYSHYDEECEEYEEECEEE